jgi:hypothetical protein
MNQQESKYFTPSYYCAQLKLLHTAKQYQGLNAGRHECTNYDKVLNDIPNFVRANKDIYLKIYNAVKAQANDLVTQSWAGRINSESEKFDRDFLIPILEKFLQDIRTYKSDYPYFVCYKLTTSTWQLHIDKSWRNDIAEIKTEQQAENLANKIVKSLANKIVKEWKEHYERLAILEKTKREEADIYEKQKNKDRLFGLIFYSSFIFIIFGIPLTIKLFPPKAPVGKYQVNHQVIPSNFSDDEIRKLQYICERYYMNVKQGKSKKNRKHYALCHNLGVEE